MGTRVSPFCCIRRDDSDGCRRDNPGILRRGSTLLPSKNVRRRARCAASRRTLRCGWGGYRAGHPTGVTPPFSTGFFRGQCWPARRIPIGRRWDRMAMQSAMAAIPCVFTGTKTDGALQSLGSERRMSGLESCPFASPRIRAPATSRHRHSAQLFRRALASYEGFFQDCLTCGASSAESTRCGARERCRAQSARSARSSSTVAVRRADTPTARAFALMPDNADALTFWHSGSALRTLTRPPLVYICARHLASSIHSSTTIPGNVLSGEPVEEALASFDRP